MAVAGRLLLIFGLITCVYGIGASLYGARGGGREWVDSGRRAMYALAGMAAIAFVILDVAFITSDFSYNIVANGSSTTTPFFYRAAAIWATQQGSLLLWVLLLSSWSSLALFLTRRRVPEIVPYAQAVLFTLCAFFVGLNVLFANPFATTSNPPPEGAGLDPLLRHTTMMVHPPMLYSGYTLLLVPFAFAFGALISGRLGAEWIQVTRRFALAAWLCLGIGILLGARWSYTELGWGGYWAWDPVENAALMPWLIATAFIHSIMIQEKRGMLKVWNVSLILTTGTLAIVGTFLVRSGILSSIHAFVSDPTLNISFVVLISAMVLSSLALVIWRRESLRTEARLDSLISREAVFLFQNLVLVALTAVIFWITFFPLISEAITGTEVSVGPPAFRPFVVPLAIIVVLLSGIGPIIAWRRVTVSKLKRSFAFPVAAMLVALVVLLLVPGVSDHKFALLMFCAGTFVVAAVAQEFYRGVRARQAMTSEPAPVALGRLVRRNRRRYGGYIVHAGVAIALIGVAASTSFQHSRTAYIRPGQSVKLDGYRFRYVRPTATVVGPEADLRGDHRGQQWRPAGHDAEHELWPVPVAGPHPRSDRSLLQRLERESRRPPRRIAVGHLGGHQPERDAASAADREGRRYLPARDRQRPEAGTGSTGQGAGVHLLRARPRDRGVDPAVRHPPVGLDLPCDRLAARDLAVGWGDHRRTRRSDRAVAAAAAAATPPGARTGARRGDGRRSASRAFGRAGLARWPTSSS